MSVDGEEKFMQIEISSSIYYCTILLPFVNPNDTSSMTTTATTLNGNKNINEDHQATWVKNRNNLFKLQKDV